MALTDNNGTQYYYISCGVISEILTFTLLDESNNTLTDELSNILLSENLPTNIVSNINSAYYFLSANDFILWGQDTLYPPVTSNNGTQYYFLKCDVPSTPNINLESNSGTAYYYSSAFNCVSFCDDISYYSPSGLEWNG
jgi:hypothetical protein